MKRLRLVWLLPLAQLMFIAGLVLVTAWQGKQALDMELEMVARGRLTVMAAQLVSRVEVALAEGDRARTRRMVARMTFLPAVEAVEVWDPDGRVLASHRLARLDEPVHADDGRPIPTTGPAAIERHGPLLVARLGVRFPDGRTGRLTLTLSRAVHERAEAAALQAMWPQALLAALVLFVLLGLLPGYFWLHRPLRRLEALADQVGGPTPLAPPPPMAAELACIGDTLTDQDRRIREQVQALNTRHAIHDALTEVMPDLALVVDAHGVLLEAFGRVDMMILPRDEAVDRNVFEMLPPDVASQARAAHGALLATGAPQTMEYALSFGEPRWYTNRMALGRLADQPIAVMLISDVTDRRRDTQRQQVQQILIDQAPVGLATLDAAGALTYANDALAGWLGLSPAEAIGRSLGEHDVVFGPDGLTARLAELGSGASARYDSWLARTTSERRPVEVRLARVAEVPDQAVAVIRDRSEAWRHAAEAERLRLTDHSTGRLNEAGLRARLLATAGQETPRVLVSARLVGFEGLLARGDAAARQGLTLLAECLEARGVASVARVSHDTLAGWLGVPARQGAALAVRTLFDVAADAMDRDVAGVRLGLRLGVAAVDPGAPASALPMALMALDHAHADQRLVFFEPALADRVDAELALRAAVRQAFDQDALQAWYQPQVTPGGKPFGAETLLRWPDGPAVSPPSVLQALTDLGLLHRFTLRLLDDALDLLVASDAGPAPLPQISVNLEASALTQPTLVDEVVGRLAARGLAPKRLILELTEHEVVEDYAAAAQQMSALVAHGVRFALDDFGTGYASLSTLHQLPFAVLKIDRAFTGRMLQDPKARSIVSAALGLARPLDMHVVAEGVETEAQAEVMATLGCDALQGWLFAQAMPADELLAWLPTAATR